MLPRMPGMPPEMNGICWAKANFDGPKTEDRPWPPIPFDVFDVVELASWPSNDLDVCNIYESWARETSIARGLPEPVRYDETNLADS